MMKKALLSIFLIPPLLLAQETESSYRVAELKQDPATTERLLIFALQTEQWFSVKRLLAIYLTFSQTDQRLVSYASIRLAQQSFFNYRNREARNAFQAVQNQANLANEEREIVEQYLSVIDKRENWQFSGRVNYAYDKNVNKTSSDHHIEDTGFIKGEGMLPQKAHGFAYSAEVEKNWNLNSSHNLHFANEISGKSYWDNHDYDELNNRTYLGYAFQNAQYRWAIRPFYERQWFSNHRYHWANGVRMEYRQAFAKNWQISTAWEFSQPRYFNRQERNGTIKLASVTLVYAFSEKGYFYLGTDFIREQTREKQYSNDLESLRAGWKQTWGYSISTQLNGSISQRQYKDFASLGGILPLNAIRRDKIYTANLTLWKNNWHWYGFTPKVQWKWKRQSSNIPSMFSYSDSYVQMLIEKAF